MNNNKNIRIIGYMLLCLGILCSLLVEKFLISRPFSIDRLLLMIISVIFISSNFILDIHKMWGFIYRKRYLIGIIIFSVLVLRGYNGSSVNEYNKVIQPNIPIERSEPILGHSRGIRSDEFIVGTPFIVSQKYYDNPTYNDAITGKATNMQLYPLYQTKSISVLATPQYTGLLVLPLEQGYSFYWFLPIFICFFSVFELCMIITKNNKLFSLLGSILITFSAVTLWWTSYAIIGYGSGAIVMFNLFLKSDTPRRKILYSTLLGWFGACFIMTLYPAWMIPYGYFFLGMVIWLLYEHRKSFKARDIIYILPVIMVIVVLVGPAFYAGYDSYKLVSNTVYPGSSEFVGGDFSNNYYNYFFSMFLPFKDGINQSEMAQFLSFYPLPIFLASFQVIKNKKDKQNDMMLNILLGVAVFLIIFNYFPLKLLAKVTLMSMSKPSRIHIAASFVCVIILIKWLSDYSNRGKLSNKRLVIALLGSGVLSLLAFYVAKNSYPDFVTIKKAIIAILYCFILMTVIILNNKKLNYIFIGLTVVTSSVFALTINPLSIGLGVLTEKPVAKEINKIVSKDSEAKWLATDCFVWLQGYALSNGAKVVNAVNYYPNFDFWHKLDPEKKYDDVYNRYAHIAVNLVNTEETSMESPQSDVVSLKLNVNDLKKIDIDYIASFSDKLEGLSNTETILTMVYGVDNTFIYKVDYN